nr:xyloglucan galactosyltransferase XLT2-like [Ipomoea batatas]
MPMILQNTSIGSLAGAVVASASGSQKSQDSVVISLAPCILPRQNPNPPITSLGTPTIFFNPKSLLIHVFGFFLCFSLSSFLSFSLPEICRSLSPLMPRFSSMFPSQTITLPPAVAQPPKDERERCEYGRVYVYDLRPMFNEDLALKNCTDLHL